MKRVFVWLTLALLPAFFTIAQESKTNGPIQIPAREARQHLDSDAIVTGKIAEVNKAQRLVRLNFDKAFPNQTLTAVIFSEKTNLFPQLDKLMGKTVQVSGRITDYHGRPEIILTSTNQLTVIEKAAESTKKE